MTKQNKDKDNVISQKIEEVENKIQEIGQIKGNFKKLQEEIENMRSENKKKLTMKDNEAKTGNKLLEEQLEKLKAEKELALSEKNGEILKKEKELEITKALQKNIQERMMKQNNEKDKVLANKEEEVEEIKVATRRLQEEVDQLKSCNVKGAKQQKEAEAATVKQLQAEAIRKNEELMALKDANKALGDDMLKL